MSIALATGREGKQVDIGWDAVLTSFLKLPFILTPGGRFGMGAWRFAAFEIASDPPPEYTHPALT